MIYAVVLGIVVATLCIVTIFKTIGVKNRTDFLVAGRKLPWPVLVFTLLSSWIGAGSLFAGGENAYRNGYAALWQPAGGWVGLLLIAVIAGRAHYRSHRRGVGHPHDDHHRCPGPGHHFARGGR